MIPPSTGQAERIEAEDPMEDYQHPPQKAEDEDPFDQYQKFNSAFNTQPRKKPLELDQVTYKSYKGIHKVATTKDNYIEHPNISQLTPEQINNLRNDL